MDERAIGEREDYLRFMTPALTEDVAITGPVTAELWVATDGPDTDFMAKLVDVYPDGYEALVLDAPIRLRYRNGRAEGRGREDDDARSTGARDDQSLGDLAPVEKGHRIALRGVAAFKAVKYPRFDVNDNNGTPPGEPAKTRVAKNTVLLRQNAPVGVGVAGETSEQWKTRRKISTEITERGGGGHGAHGE